MTTFYFTSTGNSLMVAKKIGGNLVSIPKALKEENLEIEDDAIGIVFPVYGLSVPPIILKFIEKAKLKSDYIFAVLTFGTIDGGTANQLIESLAKKGKKFSYINRLHMHENYLPGFAMEKQKKPKGQDEKLDAICADIAARKEFILENSWFDKWLTKMHQKNYAFSEGVGITKEVTVSDKCAGCATCAKVCPANNIKIENGKPIFADHCLYCLACTQNCPQNAIRLKNEKSDVRYRNPEITLDEIIKANG